MQNRLPQKLRAIIFLVCMVACARLSGNDSAASTAAGGIQLTREPRISMQKERLFISAKKVRVEYEFVNDTDRDIVTEVAFPIPDFAFEFDDPGGPRSMDDFKVWVEGKKVEFKTEVKASVGGKDITALLERYKVDANSFGHFDWNAVKSLDFRKLPATLQTELMRAGAFGANDPFFPAWTVSKTYHWTQDFPARGILHVVHEYQPMAGFTLIQTAQLDPELRNRKITEAKTKMANDKGKVGDWVVGSLIALDHEITDSCVDAKTQAAIVSAVDTRQSEPRTKNEGDNGDFVEFAWVDYILTTANSWKTPIADFELIIEKSDPKFIHGKSFVSFCWDGSIEKLDDRHFMARAKDFLPKRELHIAFFN
jgi:hypothetical protein